MALSQRTVTFDNATRRPAVSPPGTSRNFGVVRFAQGDADNTCLASASDHFATGLLHGCAIAREIGDRMTSRQSIAIFIIKYLNSGY
jgi:hypothetical protein